MRNTLPIGAGWTTLAAVYACAFCAWFVTALALPAIHYPDEIVQSLEQAHRLAFGSGFVPWEYRAGARSWLLPGLLAGPMWLGDAIAPGTAAYRWFAQGAVVALSALVPACGFAFARRIGATHAWLAAIVLATWCDLAYFGARALGEVVATPFLFAGVLLCATREARGPQPRQHAVVAGLCLGAAVAFRFHLLPAVAIAAAWQARTEVRERWLPLVLGGSVPVALLGLVDWATWGVPFASVVRNFTINLVEGRSAYYGTSGAGWYLAQFATRWGMAAALVPTLALCGARRAGLPLVVAVAIVAVHSAIPHKELRFVYPAIPLVGYAAAIGTAEVGRWLRVASSGFTRIGFPAVAAAAWMATSLNVARSDAMRPEWSRARAGLVLMEEAGRRARCGVALYAAWSWTGGYTWLHRDLPVHLLGYPQGGPGDPRSFDALIVPEDMAAPAGAGFERARCEVQDVGGASRLCLWLRPPTACQPHAATEAQRLLEATNQ